MDALQPDKTNRYVYCYNNPINLTDPLGLDADKKETEQLSVDARQEKEGQKKGETAQQTPAPPQPGQDARDVRESNNAEGDGGTTGLGVTEEGKDRVERGHREQIRVTENGEYIYTVWDNGRSYSINYGNNPGVSIGKEPSQVAKAGDSGSKIPESVKKTAIGTLEGTVAGVVDRALEKGATGAAKTFGKAGGTGAVVEGAHRAYDIVSIIRDRDPRLSRGEKAGLIGLEVAAGAASIATGVGTGIAAGAITKNPYAGIAAGAAAGAYVAEKADWVIREQAEIYRWNN